MKSTIRILVAALATAAVVASCALFGFGRVTVSGQLVGLLDGPSQAVAARGPRSLGSAIVQVAAIPVVAGEIQVTEASATEVNQDDGGFEVSVPRTEGTEHVFLVVDPNAGVGAEQAVGFVELPVGGEASAGWDLSESSQEVIDLGPLSGTSDTFLADASSQDLLAVLNADQQQLLLQAQRDNYLKVTKNRYLNTEATVEMVVTNQIHGSTAPLVNAWTDPATFVSSLNGYYTVELHAPDWSDFGAYIGADTEIVIVPPAPVNWGDTIFTPSDPITRNDINANPDGVTWFVILEGPIPEGIWSLTLDGVTDRTDDFAVSDVFDADGNAVYFVPIVRVNADTDTGRIESLELRWYYWDGAAETYAELDVTDTLPLFGGWEFTYDIAGETVDLPTVTGEALVPEDDLFLGTAPPGGEELLFLQVKYWVGETPLLSMYFP